MKIREFGKCTEVLSTQYALALYTLAESVDAHDILEIGAGWGWSARAFALSLVNRVPSRLISIDPHPNRIHNFNRVVVEDTGIEWGVLDGDSAIIMPDGEFDLIYIDGDPYRAQGDFIRFYPRLRPGGLMILDGYGTQVGPTEAVDSLMSSYHFTILPYKATSCHAIHSKPKPLLKKDGYFAVCEDCGTKDAFRNWREVDTHAKDHAMKHGHAVLVRIEPRNLYYVTIPKGVV